jgi:hypothetical protein
MNLAPRNAKNQTRNGVGASASKAPSSQPAPVAEPRLGDRQPVSPAPVGERLLTAVEIAPLIFIQPRTAALWARQGRLPAYKIGRKWGFKWSEVEKSLSRPDGPAVRPHHNPKI